MKKTNPSIVSFHKCKCGKVTVKFDNGAWNTMSETTFIKRVGSIPDSIESSWRCNGCVNNWTVENRSYTLFKIKPFVSWVR